MGILDCILPCRLPQRPWRHVWNCVQKSGVGPFPAVRFYAALSLLSNSRSTAETTLRSSASSASPSDEHSLLARRRGRDAAGGADRGPLPRDAALPRGDGQGEVPGEARVRGEARHARRHEVRLAEARAPRRPCRTCGPPPGPRPWSNFESAPPSYKPSSSLWLPVRVATSTRPSSSMR